MNPELSQDGRSVLVGRVLQGNQDVWLIDDRGIPNRITSNEGIDTCAVFSFDGNRIFFSSNRKGIFDLYEISSYGTDKAELLMKKSSSLDKIPNDCSSEFLLYTQIDEKTAKRDICVLPLSREQEPSRCSTTPFDERNPQFSPDGKWVAYESDESGRYEIYVKKFPDGSRKQISNNGGTDPRWRHDGKELYYIDPSGKMMATAIKLSVQTVDSDTPIELFHPKIVRAPGRVQYTVAPDGRFLVEIEVEESTSSPITIFTNWTRSLKK